MDKARQKVDKRRQPAARLREGAAAQGREATEAPFASIVQRLEQLEAAIAHLTQFQSDLLTIMEDFCDRYLAQSAREQERAASLRQTFLHTQAMVHARRGQRTPAEPEGS